MALRAQWADASDPRRPRHHHGTRRGRRVRHPAGALVRSRRPTSLSRSSACSAGRVNASTSAPPHVESPARVDRDRSHTPTPGRVQTKCSGASARGWIVVACPAVNDNSTSFATCAPPARSSVRSTWRSSTSPTSGATARSSTCSRGPSNKPIPVSVLVSDSLSCARRTIDGRQRLHGDDPGTVEPCR